MPQYAYIDESGTMNHQCVMSVAMVMLQGANSAQRLHDQIMTTLNPDHIRVVNRLKKNRMPLPSLHFADMTLEQKRAVAKRLARANVTVFTAHIRHEQVKSHTERFFTYKELVKACVRNALETNVELVIGIAKQGGWQKYEQDFCAELREIPEEFARSGNFRKAEFQLLSATKPGVQLADFYVGAVREFAMDDSATALFDLIREQVIVSEFHNLQSIKTTR